MGAGPGGSAAAYFLARRGRRVLLLEKQRFPRDKSCGDGLTRAGARLLGEMGLFSGLAARAPAIGGARVFVRGKGSRDYRYPPGLAEPDHGLVVPRLELDQGICLQAVAAGAQLQEDSPAYRLLWLGERVVGVEVRRNGKPQHLDAPLVIAADGAASRLARQAGLVTGAPEEMGFAIRGYYAGIRGLTDLLEIYMPLLDPTQQFILPSYGWVFPTGPDTANIGVGLFHRLKGSNVRELFARFLEELQQRDSRFQGMQARGAWLGAPLRFDFAPDRCAIPGLLLAGDAAGMISPFTGEGISYAIESGKIAAETIDQALHRGDPPEAISVEYSRRLARRYTGYFETGRQSARRYLLMWHVLESTFHNERPVFALFREAALFPEGVGESYASAAMEDVGGLVEDEALPLRADLLAVGETLLETVRGEWPFLARVASPDQITPGIPFRPALLLILAAYLGKPMRSQVQLAAAAIEQGYLAALAQLSVEDESPGTEQADGDRPANWGNLFAMMVGDFSLCKAFAQSAQIGAAASQAVADALARACQGQVRQIRHAYDPGLKPGAYLDILSEKVATLFELPCLLGARLGDCPASHVRALSQYGRQLGVAYQITEECRALRGVSSAYGKAAVGDWTQGVYSLPFLLALQGGGERAAEMQLALKRRPLSEEVVAYLSASVASSPAMEEAMALARRRASQAAAALAGLPDGPARQALLRLAEHAVARD